MAETNSSRGEPRLIWCLDSPSFGGSEIDLMRILRMVGLNNTVIVHGDEVCPELAAFFKDQRVHTQSTPTGNSLRSSVQGLVNAFGLMRKFPRANFIIWAHHADSNRWLQLAFALNGRRFVVAERLVAASRKTFDKSRLSIPIKRYVAPRAQRIVLNSKSQLEHYADLFQVNGSRLTVIPNTRGVANIGASVRELRRDKLKLQGSLGIEQGPVVVSVARFTEQKGQSDLIHAMGYLARDGAGPVLVLVGDGPDRSVLERLAREIAPANVVFAGYQEDPLPWLAAADLFVLPSLYEGMPGALIEAMAAGLPCVATDIPGNRDLIYDGETGLLAPVKDPCAMAGAIKLMLSDPQLASRCAQAGFELVAREFDESTEKEAWLNLLGELGGNSESGARR